MQFPNQPSQPSFGPGIGTTTITTTTRSRLELIPPKEAHRRQQQQQQPQPVRSSNEADSNNNDKDAVVDFTEEELVFEFFEEQQDEDDHDGTHMTILQLQQLQELEEWNKDHQEMYQELLLEHPTRVHDLQDGDDDDDSVEYEYSFLQGDETDPIVNGRHSTTGNVFQNGFVANGHHQTNGRVANGIHKHNGHTVNGAQDKNGYSVNGAQNKNGHFVNGAPDKNGHAVNGARDKNGHSVNGAQDKNGFSVNGVQDKNGHTVNGARNKNGHAVNGVQNKNGHAVNGVRDKNGYSVNGAQDKNGYSANGVQDKNGHAVNGAQNKNGHAVNGVQNKNEHSVNGYHKKNGHSVNGRTGNRTEKNGFKNGHANGYSDQETIYANGKEYVNGNHLLDDLNNSNGYDNNNGSGKSREFSLSDEDVKLHLGLAGGYAELQSILMEGAIARDTLIRNNLRLVVSIAKKWTKHHHNFGNSDVPLRSSYEGTWDRPSLDEAIQEGIIGLAEAADRFQPEKNFKFTTYATFWVTNYIRRCFQIASTNGLRAPDVYYQVRRKYNALIKSHLEAGESVPSVSVLAEALEVTPNRLQKILRTTQSHRSIDTKLGNAPFTAAGKAGNQGGDGNGETLLRDTLIDSNELSPEDHLELGMLRQTLELALSCELIPWEREVVKLRLGWDDGFSRTVPQIVQEYGGTVSHREVRSAEHRAYKKLRSPHSLSTYRLLAYLDFAGIDRADALLR